MKKKSFPFTLLATFCLVVSCCSCIGEIKGYYLLHEAYYEEELNWTSITQCFDKENIRWRIEPQWALFFVFGESINNVSIEDTKGHIDIKGQMDVVYLEIHLINKTKYPLAKSRENAYREKHPLEASMNYIISIIYNATGLKPSKKDFQVHKLYRVPPELFSYEP